MVFFFILSISFVNAYAKASCPDNTQWDGENCVNNNSGQPIIFTDYTGNIVKKSKTLVPEEIQISRPKHEILANLMIKKPEILTPLDLTGKALEQKILNDNPGQTTMSRENYYFAKIVSWSTKNAEFTFSKIVFGKDIQNVYFGQNTSKQIEYGPRYERNQDPILQNSLIFENYRAQQLFLINWGNFTD